MADSAVAEDSIDVTPAPAGMGRWRKLILFVAAPLVALIVIGAALYFTGVAAKLGIGSAGASVDASAPTFFNLPDMIVNINPGSRHPGFLKLDVTLEVAKASMLPHIRAVMPRVIDNFQTYLRELRVEDLQGASGLYRLREELLLRVNAAIAPAKVTDVLFKQMLVQ